MICLRKSVLTAEMLNKSLWEGDAGWSRARDALSYEALACPARNSGGPMLNEIGEAASTD